MEFSGGREELTYTLDERAVTQILTLVDPAGVLGELTIRYVGNGSWGEAIQLNSLEPPVDFSTLKAYGLTVERSDLMNRNKAVSIPFAMGDNWSPTGSMVLGSVELPKNEKSDGDGLIYGNNVIFISTKDDQHGRMLQGVLMKKGKACVITYAGESLKPALTTTKDDKEADKKAVMECEHFEVCFFCSVSSVRALIRFQFSNFKLFLSFCYFLFSFIQSLCPDSCYSLVT